MTIPRSARLNCASRFGEMRCLSISGLTPCRRYWYMRIYWRLETAVASKRLRWFTTNTLLNFSLRPELELHARLVADVQVVATQLGIATLITGAFARDLHLWYGHGIEIQRETEDVDFAFALPSWDTFRVLRERLISSGNFAPEPSVEHKMRHREGLPADLVPFGGVEDANREIAWPPAGDVKMNVFGYQEALNSANDLVLPGDIRSQVVSLPGLALLKLVCWRDRHLRQPRKDAPDLRHIAVNYLRAGNADRLWNEFVAWTDEDGFDYEPAGARMLGVDIGALLDDDGNRHVCGLLEEQVEPGGAGRLPVEMYGHDPDRAVNLLRALLAGLRGGPGRPMTAGPSAARRGSV